MITGGGGGQSAGFTIVETLIVLAVTGVMLLSVIGLVSGKQNKTEFQQGINDVVTQLQQIAREVVIGYYPGLTNCSARGGTLSFSAGTGTTQGSNNGCVFLGKIIQFSPADVNNGNEEYGAYTLAGCQFVDCRTTTSSPVSTSFADANPLAVQRTGSGATSSFPTDVTSWYTLENGLSTVSMSYTCDITQDPHCPATGTNPTRAVGFLQSFGTYSGCSGGGLCSGSQQSSLYGVNITGVSGAPNAITENSMLGAIDAARAKNVVTARQVTICIKSGTTDQSGLITIGPTPSSVSLKIFNGGTCGA